MNAKLEFGFFDDLAMTGNYIFWSQYTLACNAPEFMTVPSRRTLAIPGCEPLMRIKMLNPSRIEALIVRRSKRNQLRYLKTWWCNSRASRPDRLNGDDAVKVHHAK